MTKDKLFVSYHHNDDEDRYKDLLKAWSKNKADFFKDIEFVDLSTGVSINSKDSYYIKRRIEDKIINSNKILCLIGKNTYSSEWVNWEINKANELKKEIVAVKIKNEYTSPDCILNIGASWAKSFNFQSIKDALN